MQISSSAVLFISWSLVARTHCWVGRWVEGDMMRERKRERTGKIRKIKERVKLWPLTVLCPSCLEYTIYMPNVNIVFMFQPQAGLSIKTWFMWGYEWPQMTGQSTQVVKQKEVSDMTRQNKASTIQCAYHACNLHHNREGLGLTAQPAGYLSQALKPTKALYRSLAQLSPWMAQPDSLKAWSWDLQVTRSWTVECVLVYLEGDSGEKWGLPTV